MPVTTLIATTISEQIRVSFRAASASGEVTDVPERAEPASVDLRDERRDRDQDDQAQVRRDQAAPERGAPEARQWTGLGGASARAPGLRASLRSHPQELLDDRGHPVETPRSSSILATLPLLGIEELGVGLLPATDARIVDREQARAESGTCPCSWRAPTGPPAGSRRPPTAAAPAGVHRNLRKSCACVEASVVVAAGVSIRIVSSGMT